MATILGQALLGASLILLLGVLLALGCAWLPRLASRWETPGIRGAGLPQEPTLAGPLPEASGALAPRPEAGPAPAEAEPEESLVAAAIALALSLFQEEAAAVAGAQGPPTAAGAVSPWAMSGRWQAMQARYQMQKR
jgi:hypothetical protein